MHHHHRSSCFRPTPISANPNITTSLYQTELGLFGLSWSRNLFGARSLHVHFLLPRLLLEDSAPAPAPAPAHQLSFPPPSFHFLIMPPFTFWKKRGSKTLVLPNTSAIAEVSWDLSRAKFGSRPDPVSGYYVAIFIGGEMTLLVRDDDYPGIPPNPIPKGKELTAEKRNQVLVLRREHVYGNNNSNRNKKKKLCYTTRANIGGQERDVSIDYRVIGAGGEDPTLYFSIDNKRVLEVKHLKWKFRGNERIEVDGIPIQVSWDVHSWLFQDDEVTDGGGYALFMFKFEKLRQPGGGGLTDHQEEDLDKNGIMWWSPPPPHHQHQNCGFGFETKKMKKGFKLLRSGRSSSSSSLSSASSSCSSVMEWASVEENELKGPSGFSLVVYAWKSS